MALLLLETDQDHSSSRCSSAPWCYTAKISLLHSHKLCATRAKAVMSSAGLRLAVAAGAIAASLLPQGWGQQAVHQLNATYSLFASPHILFGVPWDTLVCPSS